MTRNIRKKLEEQKNLKVNLVLLAEFEKGEEKQQKNFKTKNKIIMPASNLAEFYAKASQKMLNEMEEFEIKGSQWALNRILNLELRINKYTLSEVNPMFLYPKFLPRKKQLSMCKRQ